MLTTSLSRQHEVFGPCRVLLLLVLIFSPAPVLTSDATEKVLLDVINAPNVNDQERFDGLTALADFHRTVVISLSKILTLSMVIRPTIFI